MNFDLNVWNITGWDSARFLRVVNLLNMQVVSQCLFSQTKTFTKVRNLDIEIVSIYVGQENFQGNLNCRPLRYDVFDLPKHLPQSDGTRALPCVGQNSNAGDHSDRRQRLAAAFLIACCLATSRLRIQATATDCQSSIGCIQVLNTIVQN